MPHDVFLLDTNILSNASKTRPIPTVSQWLARQTRIAIPFAAIVEIEQGIVEVSRSQPQKASTLWDWADGLLKTDFDFPAMSPDVARMLGQLHCCRPLKQLWLPDPRSNGKKPGQDLSIAATAIVHKLPIATLDAADFMLIQQYFPLPGVFNPAFGVWVVHPSSKLSARVDLTAA
ncbi:type II toxin-antitoxin system VapC family toxin [Rhizobium leguminosarum]|uniref:type II toxin-antitoxin system VapC family toxin n=1 Tax=Rhizobium leguminosarum TaxID=384 RepID=UPI0014423A6B|nr:type II toxin-antitoxin system VapC family toxin [Rhizobium leguminosarum]NKM95688.1 type II toxin-antitoxin system VapC family toxin [Rhizobium leguminosarum bv. viciae]